MARYSLEPVTRAQAVAAKEKTSRWYKYPYVVVFAGGFAVMLGVYNIDLDPANTEAWVITAAGLLAAVAGAWWIWAVAQRTGYRITRPHSEFGWLLVGPAAVAAVSLVGWGLVELIKALGFEGSKAGIAVIVAAIGTGVFVLKQYARWSTLFLGNADGLTFARDKDFAGGWNAVGKVIIARANEPGMVEIGVVPVPGVPVNPMPVRSDAVLGDLPARVSVPASKFDLDRLKWALNQSGCSDIPLLERKPSGDRLLGMSNRWHEPVAP
ncbi:hypothetical protein MINS_33890 [Mycolicibacterium insubricum]|jgi:hypothetical protein|uniref:Uncharacterized protein n=1 Tax=Mycolicibacterium insubricum TaxID=444597 RepID=A0A1X0DPE4_9MYCO|nr:hypothetical protein [Mycolicibacterium insubricum]MCV7082110.1 hypothetical protein [Mycolicibacterium insubricum]ORA74022.1 hypothetical protein BST26_00045 [Mycolicibacterium insubricum]BBZ67960.1 hypothetical protein MINS_33890 [Mycolicibacterium insubricum]